MCVTWPIHMCAMMSHSYVWHGWFICVTWIIHMCVISHSCAYVRNDWFIRVNYLIQMRTTRLVGWLRLVGSQVSFAKEHYERDYILQKRPIILNSLLIVATHIWTCATWLVACVTWLAHMCDMSRSMTHWYQWVIDSLVYAWHDIWVMSTCGWVMSNNMTHMTGHMIWGGFD